MSRPPRLYHAVTCTDTACDPSCPIGEPDLTGADPPPPDASVDPGEPERWTPLDP